MTLYTEAPSLGNTQASITIAVAIRCSVSPKRMCSTNVQNHSSVCAQSLS